MSLRKVAVLESFTGYPKYNLRNVLGRPVISSCGTPTEKVSEFLDHHLKRVMQVLHSRFWTLFGKNKDFRMHT